MWNLRVQGSLLTVDLSPRGAVEGKEGEQSERRLEKVCRALRE